MHDVSRNGFWASHANVLTITKLDKNVPFLVGLKVGNGQHRNVDQAQEDAIYQGISILGKTTSKIGLVNPIPITSATVWLLMKLKGCQEHATQEHNHISSQNHYVESNMYVWNLTKL
jgi:hypothetical protein